jgi:hypothetical protein
MQYKFRISAIALIVVVLAILPLVVSAQPGPDESTLVIAQTVDIDSWDQRNRLN